MRIVLTGLFIHPGAGEERPYGTSTLGTPSYLIEERVGVTPRYRAHTVDVRGIP